MPAPLTRRPPLQNQAKEQENAQYDTDIPIPRRQHEQNVQAWMRAAAYAAGTEPDEAFFAVTQPGDDEIHLAQAVAAEERDDLALGAARTAWC